MKGSPASFALDLQRFAKKASAVPDQILRKVVFDITREIVQKTPVRDGYAKNNWFWGVQVVSDTEDSPSRSGSGSITRAASFASTVRSGGVVYLTNNLPYILPLEFGSSQQAPAGMVRITVSRWQSIVDRAARKL